MVLHPGRAHRGARCIVAVCAAFMYMGGAFLVVVAMEMHLVNDACGVEIYEDLSAYDAADSGLDDVPLPAGTVLFLSGNNALYFRSSNAQVDDLSTDTVPNP